MDIKVRTLYLKFIVTVLLTLDEELIERYEQNSFNNELSVKVKDGIRDHAIRGICSTLEQAL